MNTPTLQDFNVGVFVIYRSQQAYYILRRQSQSCANHAPRQGAFYFVAGPADLGMVKWKEAPLPSSLLTQASPPWA